MKFIFEDEKEDKQPTFRDVKSNQFFVYQKCLMQSEIKMKIDLLERLKLRKQELNNLSQKDLELLLSLQESLRRLGYEK